MNRLIELYRSWKGHTPATCERLPGAGSNRAYYRMAEAAGQSVIGCIGTSRDENHAFIALARHFERQQLPVPSVLAVSDDELCYLQTDLGRVSLFDALSKGREAGGHYSEEERLLLSQTIRLLPRLQVQGAEGLDFSVCYPQPEFDAMNVLFDLNYFKYCFLKATGIDFHEVQLEHDFHRMAADLTSEPGHYFLYRDFQARNVMVTPNTKHLTPNTKHQTPNTKHQTPNTQHLNFIDFQGGRRGPLYYDLASFLWQASARYPDELRQQLADEYYEEACQYTAMPAREEFLSRLRLFVLFRTLQVLGAYGFRGYFERKPHFIQSIPPAIQNLGRLIDEGVAAPYPSLEHVARKLVGKFTHLVVRVYSFSYKKGIPADESGNGGGYVFDCRSTHNPGRYAPYKHLTGLDEPVIRFLEDDGEICRFLDSVYQLADAHVERYLERGFTSLMFSFGCTGGQHRSVYSAQHLAEHIHEKYGVEVHLCHREQNIHHILEEK